MKVKMVNYHRDNHYMKLVSPILENKEFSQLETVIHHGTTRMNHSIRVSYYSYKLAKALCLDYDQVARAGLLHDFFLDRTTDYEKTKDKVVLFTTGHPKVAAENAKKYFHLTEKEEDIIKTHMFPVDYRIPKYAESWIVCAVDKLVGTYEFCRKFKYQFTYGLNFSLLLMLNILK